MDYGAIEILSVVKTNYSTSEVIAVLGFLVLIAGWVWGGAVFWANTKNTKITVSENLESLTTSVNKVTESISTIKKDSMERTAEIKSDIKTLCLTVKTHAESCDTERSDQKTNHEQLSIIVRDHEESLHTLERDKVDRSEL